MSVKNHILLVEDDIDFGNILKQYLEISGFLVSWVKDGKQALSVLCKINFNICVLDVMMPKLDGFSLAEQLVKQKPEIPFVFLTARKMKEDKLRGLKLGADDYIVKPFEADELVLRLRNILNRTIRIAKTSPSTEEIFLIGKYQFDTKQLQLLIDNQKQQVTQKEAELIKFLFTYKNQLIKREEVLQAVWGNDDFFSGRSMDVFISRLRKYFKNDEAIKIKSKRGVGLEFQIKD